MVYLIVTPSVAHDRVTCESKMVCHCTHCYTIFVEIVWGQLVRVASTIFLD
jgi:hypothetical protein